MSIDEAINLVLETLRYKKNVIYVLNMGKPIKILDIAKKLVKNGTDIYATPDFKVFLYEKKELNLELFNKQNLLEKFALIDDADILTCIKPQYQYTCYFFKLF